MGVEGVEEFRRAAEALRGAEPVVYSEVGKSMRAVAKPIVGAIRDKVRSSKGSSQKGVHASAVERQLHVLARSGRGQFKALSERQVRSKLKQLDRVTSLRENIASASGASVSSSEKAVSLSFRVRAGQMPPSQRKLPRRWDASGGWKHPVFGNRKVWVKQYGNPYFRSTIFPRRDEVTAGVVDAMSRAAVRITHPDEGGVV